MRISILLLARHVATGKFGRLLVSPSSSRDTRRGGTTALPLIQQLQIGPELAEPPHGS
jgi:hypothetical protein